MSILGKILKYTSPFGRIASNIQHLKSLFSGDLNGAINNTYLGDMAEGLGIDLNSGAQSLYNSITGAGLTGAQKESYELSEQAADNAAQRSVDVFNQTQSYQAQTDQMIQAGLNPAMMYGQGAGIGGTPSGPMATAPGADSPMLAELANAMSKAALVPSQIEKNMASTDELHFKVKRGETLVNAELESLVAGTENKNQQTRYIVQNTANLLKENGWIDAIHSADIALKQSQSALNESATENEKAQAGKAIADAERTRMLAPLEAARILVENDQIIATTSLIQVNKANAEVEKMLNELHLDKESTEWEIMSKMYETGYLETLKETELRDLAAGVKLKNASTFKNYTSGSRDITGAVKDISDVAGSWVDRFVPNLSHFRVNIGGNRKRKP